MAFFSYTLTSTTTVQRIAAGRQNLIKNLLITVRTMGTASYIGIGGLVTQDRRLLSASDSFAISQNFKGDEVDIFDLCFIADTADAVIEVAGNV